MTTPNDYQPDETEAERVARQQKETQSDSGETDYRDSGSATAQNTPGPESQPNQR